ncbi:MAG: class I SAM-dependent methyltransferase [Flavobacteriales bacterium]|nr:class I SAM-dependent methyltransferase [Flavobacteriales bacterium]
MKATLLKLLQRAGLVRREPPLQLTELHGGSAAEVFTRIHDSNYWNSAESVSGTGSELRQTGALVVALPGLLKEFGITSMLDVPCGDMNWMKEVPMDGIRYIGGDIVEKLIQANRERFAARPELEFRVMDLLKDPLPACDLVLVRDCMVHLPLADIATALHRIKASGSRYLLATTFTRHAGNRDIRMGDWRPVNLEAAPFNLPAPLRTIDEHCEEAEGRYSDKAMGLWDLRVL